MDTQTINFGNLINNLYDILLNKNNKNIISEDDNDNEIIIGKKKVYPYLFRYLLNNSRNNLKYLFGNPNTYKSLKYYISINEISENDNINEIIINLNLSLYKSFKDDLKYFIYLFELNNVNKNKDFIDLINSISFVSYKLRKYIVKYSENMLYIYDNFYKEYNDKKKKALEIQELDGPENLEERLNNELLLPEKFSVDDFKAIFCVNTSMLVNYLREFRFLNEESYCNNRLESLMLNRYLFNINIGISFIRYWIDLQDLKIIINNFHKLLKSYEIISSFTPTHMLKVKFKYLYDSWQNGYSDIEVSIKQLEQLLEIYIVNMNDILNIIIPQYMEYYNDKYKEED
ncbi:hypothetical protein EOM09_02925 [bacterium]|nr:hypothetical protein [bacterium]